MKATATAFMVLAISGCASHGASTISGQTGGLKCEANVRMVGRDITFKGIDVPIGEKKFTLAEFAYKDTQLQRASDLLMQFDAAQMTVCRMANSHPRGSERRNHLEDKMVQFAESSLKAAETLSSAKTPAAAETAIKKVEADKPSPAS